MRTTDDIITDLETQPDGPQTAAMHAADELELLYTEIDEARLALYGQSAGSYWYQHMVARLRMIARGDSELTKIAAQMARNGIINDVALRQVYWDHLNEKEKERGH